MLAESAGFYLIVVLSVAVVISFIRIVISRIIRHRDGLKNKLPH
jgi:Tfp pilus assembly protein PilX